jgi:signal transduction histidine kinase
MTPRDTVKASWNDWWSFALQPRGGRWLQWLWTGLFSLAVAAGITASMAMVRGTLDAAALWPFFRDNATVSLTIGALIQAMADLGTATLGARRLRRLSPGALIAYWCCVAGLGVLAGWPLGMTLAGRDVMQFAQQHPYALRGSIVFSAMLTIGVFVWIAAVSRRTDAERRATEAQVRLLQGQMEPHFLFNTLANVLSLMDSDTPRARQMLETFIDYLRASLGQMRHERHTVADELRLVRSYLELVQMRMGDRLRFDIDASPAAERALLPPLLLQPLVENAIQHGLEPKLDGGRVQVTAELDGERLRLSVRDDGLGPDAPPRPRMAGRQAGHGMALANIRERLGTRYGSAAGLSFEGTASGTFATLELPLEEEAACPRP